MTTRRSVGGTTTRNVGLFFAVLCFFSLFNIYVLSIWYNTSTPLITPRDDSGPPVDSKRLGSQRVEVLEKEIDTVKREVAKFRDETIWEVGNLKEQIQSILASSSSSSGTNENTEDSNNRVLKVHLWDDSTLPNGYREKKLYSIEGFSTHPRTTLVDSPDDADLIVWVSVRGNTEKEVPPADYKNVVLLDYADGCTVHQKRGEVKHMIGYFKRSFVSRNRDSVYSGNCTSDDILGGVLPFAYSGLEALVNKDIHKERNTLITSVLRTEGHHNKVRARVVDWTESFIEQHGLEDKSNIGDVGSGYSSSDFDSTYLAHLADSKIIVTCNPFSWEGDFRLWEALLSGALVMVDKMTIPDWMPHPFVHKKHLVYYDTRNQTEFNSLLEYYVKHEDEARQIGEAGYNFVLEHHMAKDRVSYILDNIESRIVLPPSINGQSEDEKQALDGTDDEQAVKKNMKKDHSTDEKQQYNSLTSSNSHWDSSKSAVLGLASGYPRYVYEGFVGSLRATGFSGHIILAIAKDAPPDVTSYLAEQNVTIKYVEKAEKCTYNGTIGHGGTPIDMQSSHEWKCPKDYPDYKITWARFLYYRDWLNDCPSCSDGVMLTDVRDAFFQRDPFVTAVERNQVHPLMVFEEYPDQTTEHWLADWPVNACREHKLGKKPMLCSGSVMGSREGILDYIDVMEEEFKYWMQRENCRFDNRGDDQSIHNYLYYTNRFKNAVSIPHRQGSIHVVGFQAAQIFENATKEAEDAGVDIGEVFIKDNNWKEWLPRKYGLIDTNTGLIINEDGTPSAQVHQVDRFGPLISKWESKMRKQGWPYNKDEK